MSSPTIKYEKENLTLPQRWAGLYTTILMLLLLVFFGYHQWAKDRILHRGTLQG